MHRHGAGAATAAQPGRGRVSARNTSKTGLLRGGGWWNGLDYLAVLWKTLAARIVRRCKVNSGIICAASGGWACE